MAVSIAQYIFGNSLVNYAEGGALTNVPVWFNHIAQASGDGYSVSGGYGFLRDFADRDAPLDQWGFPGVADAWDEDAQSFDEADFNSVLITPANFIQYAAPDMPYPGDTTSPVDETADLVSMVTAEHPDAQILIYQGWAELAPFISGMPPTDAEMAAYHDYNLGAYTDWYEDFANAVSAAVPSANIQILPVASVLSELLTGPLADIPVDELYVDDAPHGTETLYFLASLVTYSGVTGQRLPENLAIPDTIHPEVAAHFEEVSTLIEARVAEYVTDTVEEPAPETDTQIVDVPGDIDSEASQVTTEPDTTQETAEEPEGIAPPPEPAQPSTPETAEPSTPPVANMAPDAVDDTFSIGNDEALIIDVLANDTDVNGDTLEILSVGGAGHGQLSLSDGLVSYLPDPDFVGQDYFYYYVGDGKGGINEGVVTVSVTAPEPEETPPDPFVLPHTGLDQDPDLAGAPEPAPVPGQDSAPNASSPESDATLKVDLAGFTAKYYALDSETKSLDELNLAQMPHKVLDDQSIGFPDPDGAAWDGGRSDWFASRFTQDLKIETSGTYRFDIATQEEAILLIDEVEMASRPAGEHDTPLSAEIWLDAGTHDLEIRHLEDTGDQSLMLDMFGPLDASDDDTPDQSTQAQTDCDPQTSPEDAVADLLSYLRLENGIEDDTDKHCDDEDWETIA